MALDSILPGQCLRLRGEQAALVASRYKISDGLDLNSDFAPNPRSCCNISGDWPEGHGSHGNAVKARRVGFCSQCFWWVGRVCGASAGLNLLMRGHGGIMQFCTLVHVSVERTSSNGSSNGSSIGSSNDSSNDDSSGIRAVTFSGQRLIEVVSVPNHRASVAAGNAWRECEAMEVPGDYFTSTWPKCESPGKPMYLIIRPVGAQAPFRALAPSFAALPVPHLLPSEIATRAQWHSSTADSAALQLVYLEHCLGCTAYIQHVRGTLSV